MKVHLIRSPELDQETYRNVLHLLQQFPGLIVFEECEEDVLEHIVDSETKEWEDEDLFKKKETDFDKIQASHSIHFFEERESIEFPYEEPTRSWDELFQDCKKYREEKDVDYGDLVILLTDFGNEHNWFGAVDQWHLNFFVQTSNWNFFLGNSIDDRFPIAYEITVWIMRTFMFSDREDMLRGVHKEPLGCIMDLCEDKSQIKLKMRTADLCSDCMDLLFKNETPVLYSRQFFEILDGIRKNMTFRERSRILAKPSRIEIRGYMNRIFLSDLGDLEVRLNPKERALYLLFLNHPEGMHLTELQDHYSELAELYSRFTNQYNQEHIDSALKRLVDPLENDINVVLSRIKRKFKDAVGDNLLDNYQISGIRGERKKIMLDREFVSVIN